MTPSRQVRCVQGGGWGKIILLGEHAVVYGYPALAAALNKGVLAEAAPSDVAFFVRVDAWNLRISPRDGSAHGRALSAMLARLGLEPDRLTISLTPAIPSRAGLGASAAVAAAMARCLASQYELSLQDGELYDAVQASESVFHGNPSGLDATMALKGGIGLFNRASGFSPIRATLPRILIVHSGAPKDTAASVAKFKVRMDEAPKGAKARLSQIASLVREGVRALEAGDDEAFGALMTENHRHLQWFNVSTAALDNIVDIALRSGALGAKLTGGGCGGCAVVALSKNDEDTEVALRRAGYEVVDS